MTQPTSSGTSCEASVAVEMPDTESRLQVAKSATICWMAFCRGLVQGCGIHQASASLRLRCLSAGMRLTAAREFSASAFCQFSDARGQYVKHSGTRHVTRFETSL
jgi:hypothetical protein